MIRKALLFAIGLIAALLAPMDALAIGPGALPPPEQGKELFTIHCVQCHGPNGEGDGTAAPFLPRPPRDFTEGVFKLKSSPPESYLSRDEDIFEAISNGMSSSGMPPWKDMISEEDRWRLVAYVKSLSDLFEDEENPPALDMIRFGGDDEFDMEKGREAWEALRCPNCHGLDGDQPTDEVMKDAYGKEITPRNLKKPWTFIGGGERWRIYAMILNGIPLTPMPSHVKTASPEEIRQTAWLAAGYVAEIGAEARLWRSVTSWGLTLGSFLLAGGLFVLIGRLRRRKKAGT